MYGTSNDGRDDRQELVSDKDASVDDLLTRQWLSALGTDKTSGDGNRNRKIATAVYARYSPRPEETETSITRQIAACRAYLESIGAPQPDPSRIFIDRMASGAGTADRPAYAAMIRDLEQGGHSIAVAESADRVTRDMGELARINGIYLHVGGSLHFADRGRLSLSAIAIHGFLGMEQRLQLLARTRMGRHLAARAGRSTGKPPYGYISRAGDRGALAIVDQKAEIVRLIFLAFAGGSSIRSIVISLNRDGIPGPKGGLWNRVALNGRAGLLRNPLYGGVMVFGRTRYDKDPVTGRTHCRDVPPRDWIVVAKPDLRIVDQKVYEEVHARLATGGAGGKRPRSNGERLLVSRIFCPCGSPMVYIGAGLKTDPSIVCNRHSSQGACTRTRSLAATVVERSVLQILCEDVLEPVSDADRESIAREAKRTEDARRVRHAMLERRFVSIERQLERTLDPVSTAGFSMERLLAERVRLEGALVSTSEELFRLQPSVDSAEDHDPGDLRRAFTEAARRVPFRALDDRDREIVRSFRSLVGRIELDLDRTDRGFRLIIQLRPHAHRQARTGQAIERVFDAPRFGVLGDPSKAAAADRAAQKGLFALADDDWEMVEHLFKDYRSRRLGARLLLDAMLFHAWTTVPITTTPRHFGNPETLRCAALRLVRSGLWDRVVSILRANDSPTVAHLDVAVFDHWKADRPARLP
nr:recombinase family protein [Methylobacterium sp. L1A1]